MNRKEFLRLSACAAAAAAWKWDGVAATAGSDIVSHDAPPRNRRPYSDIDWADVSHIRTSSHAHCDNQNMLDAYVKKRGFGFLTISNYYPSAPVCPLGDILVNHFRVNHDFPVVVNGRRTPGPFDWNAIVSEWKEELPEREAAQLPFRTGGRMFKPLPPGILEAPNAEHHWFLDPDTKESMGRLHLCSPGSAFASGTFDKGNRFKTSSKGWESGSGEPWTIAIDRIIAGLIDPQGGGVTINHPTWTGMDYGFPSRMLDHDQRVLGLEVLNANSNTMSEDYWDYTLRTGRQCFGFFVPDHRLWRGCNVLLVGERTVEACLRAYRQGNFYGAVYGNGVRFTRIAFDGRTFEAETDGPVRFSLVSAVGEIASKTDTGFSFKTPASAKSHVYLRLKAYSLNDAEVLFSQPFML